VNSVVQDCRISAGEALGINMAHERPCWYAIHTRPRHEKRIEARLRDSGVCTFLPLISQVQRWSDRRKVVKLPLFSCYLFVNTSLSHKTRFAILQTEGVLGLVGIRGEPTAISDPEIEGIRILLSEDVNVGLHEFLKAGQRVRIRGGSLDGVEGLIVVSSSHRKLVVSIGLIQRSVAVSLDGYDVEPLDVHHRN
jgi:transcription antitermination factor NusG